MFSILLLVTRKLYVSFSSFLDSLVRIISFAKTCTMAPNLEICQLCISKTRVQRQRFKVDLYSPIIIGKLVVTPSSFTSCDPLYISLIVQIQAIWTSFFCRNFHKTSLATLQYSFSKSMKIIRKSLYPFDISSVISITSKSLL